MTVEDLCYTPATELRSRIADKSLSPVELTEAVIARTEQVQPSINPIALSRYEQARETAREAEAAVMRGDALGPLHGIPITIKDNVSTIGDRTTNGSYALADFVPETEPALVQRLRSAGAIIFAKTTTPEFAHRVLTETPLFGVTRNPWSLEHTPGGSSGGASAAVAAGCGPMALGTDGGGSIRCPASCAGIAGIKPTLGRVPMEFFGDAFFNYAGAGPLTRTIDDLALMLSVMSGPFSDDLHTLEVAALPVRESPLNGEVSGLRIAWIERFGDIPLDPEVAELTTSAVRAMEAAGAKVEAISEPAFADVFVYYAVIATTAHAGRLTALLEKWGDKITPSMRASIEQGGTYSAADLVRAGDRRTALYRRVQTLFKDYDLILTPTMNAPPKTVDENGAINSHMYSQWAGYLYPFNMTSNPAASIPVGFTANGLPVGLQIVGAWYDEPTILKAMAWLEKAMPWAQERPVL